MTNILKFTNSTQPITQNNNTVVDDYNPIEAAKFVSEISKYMGEYRTPAQEYRKAEEFQKELAQEVE